MYKVPRFRGGTYVTGDTEDHYRPVRGLGNYGLFPVKDKYEDERWEKTKKEIAQDFQKMQKTAVTYSRDKATKTFKSLRRNPGYAVALGLGIAGAVARYCGLDGLDGIGDELIASGVGAALTQHVASVVKKYGADKKARKEAVRYDRMKTELREEIRDLLRDILKKEGLGVNEKITRRGRVKNILGRIDAMTEEDLERARRQEIDPLMESMEKRYVTEPKMPVYVGSGQERPVLLGVRV